MFLLNLGRQSYARVWELQHQLVKARQEERLGDILILLEHDPVITLGRSADAGHILASPEVLQREGIEVHRIERGGDVTYHGPGQLVGYPILRLESHRLGISDYMHTLEEVLIRTLRELGLSAGRRKGLVGVWVQEEKIAMLGARVERGVTYHGFALNVAPNLEHFSLIVPCGLTDIRVTSVVQALGKPVDMDLVRRRVAWHFAQTLGVALEETTVAQLCVQSGNCPEDNA